MLKVRLVEDEIRIGPRFRVSFQRTLRIPDDGGTYPLPPGLGRLPLHKMSGRGGGYVLPLAQSEALWLAFDGASWKPNAVQIGIGGINAVSGEAWEEGLSAEPQNYLICPDQLWLDGINAGAEMVRQFVAMPLGSGTTVEAQLTGREEVGGIQVRVFEPKPGRFPDRPPRLGPEAMMQPMAIMESMGLGAGGQIRQKIYPDPYGLDTWDPENSGTVFVHIVNSEQYEALTGEPAPPSPLSAAAYTEQGFPWFDLYDEEKGDVAAPRRLSGVKAVRGKDEETVKIEPGQVRGLKY